MNGKSSLVRTARALAAVLFLFTLSLPVRAIESYLTRTNWVEKTITNLIEVRMPKNVFVNEYRTNWVEQVVVNVVDVYKTNQALRTLTNTVVVDAFRTNFVQVCQTNWKNLSLTNWQTI